jgi:hypothetical protein
MKDRLAQRLGIYWPFPRLRYFLRHGHLCSHEWGRWQMIDLGRRKMRRCGQCQHTEFLP